MEFIHYELTLSVSGYSQNGGRLKTIHRNSIAIPYCEFSRVMFEMPPSIDNVRNLCTLCLHYENIPFVRDQGVIEYAVKREMYSGVDPRTCRRRGAKPSKGGVNLIFYYLIISDRHKFDEMNANKNYSTCYLKKCWSVGGTPGAPPLDSPLPYLWLESTCAAGTL